MAFAGEKLEEPLQIGTNNFSRKRQAEGLTFAGEKLEEPLQIGTNEFSCKRHVEDMAFADENSEDRQQAKLGGRDESVSMQANLLKKFRSDAEFFCCNLK